MWADTDVGYDIIYDGKKFKCHIIWHVWATKCLLIGLLWQMPAEMMFNKILIKPHNKQRVLMHGHQGWNVRHGLCHIYMRYVYIWVVYSLCCFCCLFITHVTVTWWYMWCIEWGSGDQEEVQACLVTLIWLFIISCYSLYKTTTNPHFRKYSMDFHV